MNSHKERVSQSLCKPSGWYRITSTRRFLKWEEEMKVLKRKEDGN